MKIIGKFVKTNIILGLFLIVGLVLPVCEAQEGCPDCSYLHLLNTTPSPNQIAAGGPLPGNYTIAFQEAKCTAEEGNDPWYPTLLSYEAHDSNRTKCYQCAQFTGSLTGPNTVYAYQSPDRYYMTSMIATRGMNEMYAYGGAAGAVPLPSASFVARVEPGSLKELWRTYLINTNITGQWIGAGSIESIDGYIFAITNTYLYKLNGTTGAVEEVLSLPTGKSTPSDSYFNGMGGWPDGTLIMKNLARAPGCTYQGFAALAKCPNLNETPTSAMVAVDSKTFKILDWVQLEQMIGGRITATQYHGKNYAYIAGQTNLYRYEWNGKNLSLDTSWGPVPYLLPGQTPASAAAVMGDWVILMTNGGAPTSVPLSLIAISQANASKLTRIEPMPLQPGQVSYIPSMSSVDMDNNRIYAMDPGPGKVVGIDIDQETGNMSLAWSANQTTLSWLVLVGPDNHRVLIGTNISSNVTNPLDLKPGPIGANYIEQVQWRDAATGKLLATSDFFSPMVPGFEVWPGYGGLFYEALTDGRIMALQVLPKSTGSNSTSGEQT